MQKPVPFKYAESKSPNQKTFNPNFSDREYITSYLDV